jgi:uncharacterized protein YecT (DUF1311 family)
MAVPFILDAWRGAALAIVAMGAIAAPTPLLAAPSAQTYYSKTYTACMATGLSTLEMRDCQNAEYADWDKALNGVYQTLMANRSAPEKLQLRDDERAWLKRTKAKCDHAGDSEAGGTLQPIEVQGCYLDETILRTVYLRGLH